MENLYSLGMIQMTQIFKKHYITFTVKSNQAQYSILLEAVFFGKIINAKSMKTIETTYLKTNIFNSHLAKPGTCKSIDNCSA